MSKKHSLARGLLCAGVVYIGAFSLPCAKAQTVSSWSPVDGSTDWFDPANWSSAEVPGGTTPVMFVDGGTADINGSGAFSGGVDLGSLDGSPGTVNVSGLGTWTINGSLGLGWLSGAGVLRISGGGGVSVAEDFILGGDANAGTLSITGAGSWLTTANMPVQPEDALGAGAITVSEQGRWDHAGYLDVHARRTMIVATGGIVESQSGRIAGTVNISGADSRWSISQGLSLAGEGSSSLTISSGGEVSAGGDVFGMTGITVRGAGSALRAGSFSVGSMTLADSAEAEALSGSGGMTGVVNVSGNARWTLGKELTVFSTGALTLGSGGVVSSKNGGTEGAPAHAEVHGAVSIGGSGSHWTHEGVVRVGGGSQSNSHGRVTLSTGGRLTATDTLWLAMGPGAKADVEVSRGATLAAGEVQIGAGQATATLSGTLQTARIWHGASSTNQGPRKIVFDGGTWEVSSSASGDILAEAPTGDPDGGGFRAGDVVLNGTGVVFAVGHAAGGGALDVSVSAVLTGAGGVEKTGAGRLLLAAENTFTGEVLVREGILALASGALDQQVSISLDNAFLEVLSGSISVSGLSVNGVAVAPGKYSTNDAVFDGWALGAGEVEVIPEPSTYALWAGTALLTVGVFRWRKKPGKL